MAKRPVENNVEIALRLTDSRPLLVGGSNCIARSVYWPKLRAERSAKVAVIVGVPFSKHAII